MSYDGKFDPDDVNENIIDDYLEKGIFLFKDFGPPSKSV